MQAADAARSAILERVVDMHRDDYMRTALKRGVRVPAGVDWKATAVSLGWLGNPEMRAAKSKRMWRKLLTSEERMQKFSGMDSDERTADGKCRYGCRCNESVWYAIAEYPGPGRQLTQMREGFYATRNMQTGYGSKGTTRKP